MSSPFLAERVAEHAARTPTAPAVDSPEHRLSYAELHERIGAFASALRAAGLPRGGRVLIALPHAPAGVVASLGAQAAGGSAVVIGRDAGAEALRSALEQTGARHLVVAGRDARAWAEALRGCALERAWVVHPGEIPAPLVEACAGRAEALGADGRLAAPGPALPPAARSLDEEALVVFTSGSTGKPRGVIQTFRNLAANTASIIGYLGLTPADRAMLILPLSYCYGRSVLQTHLWVGGSVFLDDRFAFPRVVLEAIGSEGCTGFAGVPLTFEVLKRQVAVGSIAMPRLRYLTQAGGAMHPDTVAWVRQAFAPARLFVMYGQTEATARLAYLPPERAQDKVGSIGVAIPGVTLSVLDEAGQPLAPGEQGELVARGENVTPGYLGAEEETRALLRGGWLHTGDIAYRDADGYFFVTGRAKDQLKVGGHRMSPREVEEVLARHPGLREVAVVGRPDPLEGEVPVAFAVAATQPPPPEAELLRHCRAALPAFKVPRAVIFVDALPHGEAGKVQRKVLAERLAAQPLSTGAA